jgi:Killing trait
MPSKPKGRSKQNAARPGAEQDKPQTGESAGSDQSQAGADQGSRRDRTFADFCEKLRAQTSSFDPATIMNQIMLMAASAPAASLFAANHADALMFYNAVANQQKTNILGMSVTAKCVRYMFEAGEGDDDDDIDILEQSLDNG